MSKTVSLWGATYNDVPAIEVPSGTGTAVFYDVTGSQTITENGTYDVTDKAEVVVNVSSGSVIDVVDTLDSHGGTIRTITAEVKTSGSVGTPTASKGSVSNNSVHVTPSVTTTSGYISGETKTGTPVTVSASELVSGSQTITENGIHDVTNLAQVVVNVSGSTGKNVQAYRGYATVTATSYTATDVTITVAKTGTYNVSWMGYRNTNTGTSGSQLYKNGTAVGSANTTFVNTYGQYVSLTNQSFNAGDVLVVRARARSTSYVMGVGNLIIEEV